MQSSSTVTQKWPPNDPIIKILNIFETLPKPKDRLKIIYTFDQNAKFIAWYMRQLRCFGK